MSDDMPFPPERTERYRRDGLRCGTASSVADRHRAGTARLITVWRTDADLRAMDLALDNSDRGYGSVYGPSPVTTNYGIVGFGRLSTPDAWLSTWSAHSSNATIAKTGPDMHLPTLLISYTADNCVFPRDFDAICDAVASSDREIHRVAADHYGNPAPGAELRRDHVAPLISRWLRELK